MLDLVAYVLDEALTGLSRSAGATVAMRFLDLLEAQVAAGLARLVEINRPRREEALVLFRRLAPDVPRLSFTDCTSFAVMQELGITVAISADRHFHRPGGGIRPLFSVKGTGLVWSPE